MNIRKPGYQTTKELFNINLEIKKRYVNKIILPFVNLKQNAVCLDVGKKNPLMEVLKEIRKDITVHQWDTEDLNFDKFPTNKKYDVIFAFNILEHIQNCLWTVKEMKKALKDNGSIYINLPENPFWLWSDNHYFEFPKGHFEKWILNPLNLRIIRQKKIFFVADWKAFLIGFRPLYKAIKNKNGWKNVARNMFCWNFRIYEVKNERYN